MRPTYRNKRPKSNRTSAVLFFKELIYRGSEVFFLMCRRQEEYGGCRTERVSWPNTWDEVQGFVSLLLRGAVILASKIKVYRKDTKLVLFADARTAALLRRTKLAGRRAFRLAMACYCIDKDAHVCCQSLRKAAGAVRL